MFLQDLCDREARDILQIINISNDKSQQVQEERHLRRTRVKAFQFQTSVGHYLALENFFKPGLVEVRPAKAFCPARAVVS